MDGPGLWDALRSQGVLADDPDVRRSVRGALDLIEQVRVRVGPHHARRCAEAMQLALVYELRHPDTGDMSVFEDEFGEADGSAGQ